MMKMVQMRCTRHPALSPCSIPGSGLQGAPLEVDRAFSG